jgi:hypothetical protein
MSAVFFFFPLPAVLLTVPIIPSTRYNHTHTHPPPTPQANKTPHTISSQNVNYGQMGPNLQHSRSYPKKKPLCTALHYTALAPDLSFKNQNALVEYKISTSSSFDPNQKLFDFF